MNRNDRRAAAARMKKHAPMLAAQVAGRAMSHRDGKAVRVDNPAAVRALTRVMTRMMRGGGKPMALPLSEEEARAFPQYRDTGSVIGVAGVSYIAAGVDVEGNPTWTVQTAWCPDRQMAHDGARLAALNALLPLLPTSGIPGV